MSLYAIGDLHLSLSVNKPMDIFGGWDNYVEKLKENWQNTIKPDDTVVLVGDTSWAMNFDQATEDFRFVHNLNGHKIVLKGNHDYWWATRSKMEKFLYDNGFDSIEILHNNHVKYDKYGICGTRGWINDNSEPADAKVLAREAARLRTSIKSSVDAGLEPIVFIHYPPIYGIECNYEILEVLYEFNIKNCYYGHIHGKGAAYAINGERDGVKYELISSDFLQFQPKKIM